VESFETLKFLRYQRLELVVLHLRLQHLDSLHIDSNGILQILEVRLHMLVY